MSVPCDLAGIVFVPATDKLLPGIVQFLSAAGLLTEDLSPANLFNFEVALDQAGEIAGVGGLEVADGNALLRSVAVTKEWRGKGLGRLLVARREQAAKQAAAGMIYLLTETADDFFHRLGYEDEPRTAIPAAISAHAQFRTLCPVSAKCLGKRL